MKKSEMSAEKIAELQEFVEEARVAPVVICSNARELCILQWSRTSEKYEVVTKEGIIYQSDDLTPAVRKWETELWLIKTADPVRL